MTDNVLTDAYCCSDLLLAMGVMPLERWDEGEEVDGTQLNIAYLSKLQQLLIIPVPAGLLFSVWLSFRLGLFLFCVCNSFFHQTNETNPIPCESFVF